jgi:hypothetical protein
MAFGTISSTSNTFGSVDGTATGVVPGTLSGSVGVPGPQGPAGSQGPQGEPGEGVPAGGTAGQVLAKVDGVDYNTEWINVDVSGYRSLTDYDFTNVANTNLTTFGLTLEPSSANTYDSYLDPLELKLSYDNSDGGAQEGEQRECFLTTFSLSVKERNWVSVDGVIEPQIGSGFQITASDGLRFIEWGGAIANNSIRYTRTNISFTNGSVQTIAFPGFNNAALTGNPTAPTPATSDNDTSIATTAFVKAQGYAPLASPALTGNPTAPTAALGDNDTSIATTAFVQQELLSGTANARNLEVYVRNQTGSTIPIGSIVYINGATGNRPTITLAQANNDANSAQTIGFTKTAIANNGFGFVIVRGELENINTSALTEGVQLYLSPTTAGTWTTTKPSAPQHLVYVGVVIRAHPTQGTILVSVQNGYELHELHDVALASEANNDLLVYELSTDLWKNKSFSTLGLAGLNSPAFTGTPSLPTGTTAVTQTAGDNTTALATTAFVTTSNPDASTTVKGHVELATDLEAYDGTSATTAIAPFTSVVSQMSPSAFVAGVATGLTASQTAGSSTMFFNGGFIDANGTGVGYASRTGGSSGRGGNSSTGINWAKPVAISGRINAQTNFQTQCVFRMNIGAAVSTLGTPSVRSIGVFFGASATNTLSALVLEVHDGTTLTSVTTSFTPTFGQLFDVLVYSDGTGNAYCYVNGSLVGSSAAAPSTAASGGQNLFVIGLQNVTTPTAVSRSYFYNLKWLIN